MGTQRDTNEAVTRSEPAESTTRRRALAVAAMALGATAGTLLTRNTAEAHGQLHVDSATTDPAIHGNNTNPTDDAGEGVLGTSLNGPGVRGVSTNDVGVRGRCDNGSGVNGNNDGVGAGVVGRARNGAGVRGIAPGENPGVLAQSGLQRPNQARSLDNALALLALGHTLLRPATAADGTLAPGPAFSGPTLEVIGFARLGGLSMPIGSGTIQARERVHLVVDAAAGGASHISVVLVGAPKRDEEAEIAVSWVERAAGSFRIHLTEEVDLDTPFTYTIVNP